MLMMVVLRVRIWVGLCRIPTAAVCHPSTLLPSFLISIHPCPIIQTMTAHDTSDGLQQQQQEIGGVENTPTSGGQASLCREICWARRLLVLVSPNFRTVGVHFWLTYCNSPVCGSWHCLVMGGWGMAMAWN